jgi:type II restriction/modification system DNA methylase subunit YeeA
VLGLPGDGMDILARASTLDWSNVEPSILGTLFERSLDPSRRAQLGAHYTSKEDILLIVEPVLMAPLRRRWAEVQARARDMAARRDAAKGGQRTRLQNDLTALLRGFADEIAQVQVLDAACGSGNFLYIALKRLLDLQKEVITFAGEVGAARFFPGVSPAQLHGIEVNEYAHELAQATIWIGYIQWLRENGFGFPAEPILKPIETVRQMDAILTYDEQGRPVEPEWPQADVIIGNPPFLGGKRLRAELGDQYVEMLFKLYDNRVPHEADLVCYWFERARAQIERGKAKRAGLLATQAIRGGANRKVLARVKETGDIFWAQSDRDWILDGATVHVSMVGFDDGTEQSRALDDRPVPAVNANLTGAVDLTAARRLAENMDIAFMGDTKGGAFDISEDVATQMLHAPLNPNGRDNHGVVRPWANGMDIAQRPRRMWIVDFGVNMPEEEAALYEAPFEYVVQHVKSERLKNRRAAYRERWWIHVEPRPAMRAALTPLSRYVATLTVSKHRLFAWLEHPTLPDHQLIVFARDDDYFFGVLHSKLHELWARGTGTQLREAESGFRYTPTSTFETFPFPWPPGQEPKGDPRVQVIAQAARELVEKRDAWLNPPGATEAELKKRTLTNLYNQRPTWLDLAHRKLDEAVLDAYGWPHNLSDEEILARLLALNLTRSAAKRA